MLAFAILFFVFLFNAQRTTQTVGEVVPKSPAAGVLAEGDRVIAVDGKTFSGLPLESRLERFGKQVASHKCAGKQVDGCRAATPVELTVSRGGEVQTISVRPEYEKSLGRTRIGFSYGSAHEEIGAGTAFSRAGDAVWTITSKTATVFANLTSAKERKQVSGIVGVSDVAHQAVDVGITPALILLALVSLSLGLINLLPILPLDGGHIFWSLVEKMRGKTGLAAGDGAGQRDRLRPGRDADVHRPLQRHRPPHRRRVQRPVTGPPAHPDTLSRWLPSARYSSAACRSAAAPRSPCRR